MDEIEQLIEVIDVGDVGTCHKIIGGNDYKSSPMIKYDRINKRLVSGFQYNCICGGKFRLTSWCNHKQGIYHTTYIRKLIELNVKQHINDEYLSKPRNFIIHKRTYTRKQGKIVIKFGSKIRA